MFERPHKKRRLLSPSAPFRAPESRSPVHSTLVMPSRAPSPEPVARSGIISEGTNEQNLETPPNPSSIAVISGENLQINGGKFIQNINNRNEDSYNILKHVAFQSLPRSRDAAYSAAINLDGLSRRSCTKGTRVDTIAQIMAWVNERDPVKAPPVYWLTGLAGLGKTTIAYTICELLQEAHMPFASFFCSLQLDSKNSKLLVTTLCRDLAELYNSYAIKVLPILETNSKVADAGLRIQIDELLAKPWQASASQRKSLPTPIVVVDALDECDRGTQFLEILLHIVHVGRLAGIKFLVTSRPEPNIADICKSFPPNAVCKLHEVDSANVRNDIETYLREALPELKDDPELGLLSQQAGGWFIYATTAVRFISPPQCPPSVTEMHFHLQSILKPGPLSSRGDSAEGLLVDELYARILSDAFQDARVRATRLRILHTILCAESRIDLSVLADLTNIDPGTVKRVIESLHAVLYISSKDGCVCWYHASFPDFFFSQARAKICISESFYEDHPKQEFEVFCNVPAHHGALAERCFSIMQESLHFNMCDLPSSYAFDSEVPGLDALVDETFSSTIRYVSRYWARHLFWAMPSRNDHGLFRGLKDFLENQLLFWIEAMNLIGAIYECSPLLKDAESCLKRGMEWPDLVAQLGNASNFSAFYAGSPASKSTPHLYVSALSMWNQRSTSWFNWRNRFKSTPTMLLPRGAITIPLLTISTASRVNCIAFSPDGNNIASGHDNNSMQVWDIKTGKHSRDLQGHTWRVNSVAFSPDGNRIVSGSGDYSVRVWDAKTGKQLLKLRGHTRDVSSVAFSPSGNQIISGSWDKSVRVWDVKSGGLLMELRGHTRRVTSVAFSSDSNRIVSGSGDTTLRVWEAKAGEELKRLQGHTDSVTSVAFSPDGNHIVSGSLDKLVRVWNARTGEPLRGLHGHISPVNSVVFLPDGIRIVSGSDDNSVRVWDAKTGKQLMELQGHTGSVTSVIFSLDGNLIVSGSYDESVRVWDGKMEKQLLALQGHNGDVNSVAFSPDGHQIVSGSDDKSIWVWDAKTGKGLMELRGHTDFVTSVAFSPNGNKIISGSFDNSVRLWNTRTGQQLRVIRGHIWSVNSVAFSPDGNQIVSGSDDKSVRVWDAETGKQLRELQGHTGEVYSVVFSPYGDRILSGSEDNSVGVWDANTGNQLRKLEGLGWSVTSVAFSPDGEEIVSGSYDKSVWVWDTKTGEQVTELRGHPDFVTSLAFSPDGNQIVSGSGDYSLRVWDVKTGEQLRELRGHTNDVNSIAFSPDGNRIISGSADHSVRVWGNLEVDASWVIHEDGWIVSGGKRLVWVPSTIRDVLLRPHNTLIISRNGSAAVSFKDCKLGSLWSECYIPSLPL